MDASDDHEPLHPNDAWLMAQVDQNMLAPAASAAGGLALPLVAAAVPDDDDERVTYEDSEMFEEDIVSLASETESVNQNWRGWSGVVPLENVLPEPANVPNAQASTSAVAYNPQSLKTTCAKVAAMSMSFEQMEMQNGGQPIPSDVFVHVIRYCFPQNSEDVRMYSFLTNASGNEYHNGFELFSDGAVKKALQIGYHLTATVDVSVKQQNHSTETRGRTYDVDISVDRCRIVSCTCSCTFKSSWCQHVVAVCLHRIHHPNDVEYRGTIWDSLNHMSQTKLIKLAQYLINALPRQYLPVAQGLIDDLRNPNSEINQSDGAPDPTDGGHQEQSIWCLDGKVIKENIHKVLTKICVPGPTVHCDVNCLSNNPSPTLTEWQALHRSLKSKDPEGLWNLLSIASDMLKRGDPNAISLLHIVTEELMASEHVLYWWYITKLSQSGFWMLTNASKAHFQSANGNSAQFNCSSLCDEIVNMWRLAAMNPKWTYIERENLFRDLKEYHRTAVTTISQVVKRMSQNSDVQLAFGFTVMDHNGCRLGPETARFSVSFFPGFFDALSACMIEWDLTNIEAYISGESAEFEGNFKVSVSNISRSFSSREFASEISSLYDIDFPNIITGKTKCERRGIKKTRKSNVRYSIQSRHLLLPDGSMIDPANPGTSKHRSNRLSNKAEMKPTCSKNIEIAREKREKLLNDDFEQIVEHLHLESADLDARYNTCEALMAHGYTQQARQLAVSVAEEMNKEPISLLLQFDLMAASGSLNGTARKTSPQRIRRKKQTHTSVLAAQNKFRVPDNHVIELTKQAAHLFSRAIFLTNVLSTERHCRKVAFSLALAVLSAARGPAATRHLEVKLYYYEACLVTLLREFAIEDEELALVRSVALQLLESSQQGKLVRVTALPLTLIQYFLETLSESRKSSLIAGSGKTVTDKDLGFYVALEGLGMPLYVSETDHPMLCECVRRLRGEIALNLFTKYKDSSEKLGLILDRLLDPNVHRMYKNQESNAAYFLERTPSLKTFYKLGTRPKNTFNIFTRPEEPEKAPPKSLHSTSSSASLSDCNTPSSSSEDRSSQTSVDPDLSYRDDISSVDSERGLRRSTDEGHESRDESPRFSDSSSSGFNNRPPVQFTPNLHRHRIPMRLPPPVPEPLAMFMAELSKKLLNEAGGNQSTAIFNPQNGGQAHVGPHRLLHISSFLMGLYALGLHNKMQLNWPTRTYSTQASWIHAQAIDIGRCAIEIVRHTWDNHLTPTEVAALADKASQCREAGLVEEGAYLALSVLPRADALTISESNRALDQCKDKGLNMLELACEAVGKAADADAVYPEVLFNVAHYWFDLSEAERDRTQDNTRLTMNTNSPHHLYTDGFNSYRYEPSSSVQINCNQPIPYVAPMIDVRRPPPNYITVQQRPGQHPPQIHAPALQFDNINRPLHASHSAPNLNPMHPIPPPYLGGAYVITSNQLGQPVMSSLYAQSPMAPRVTIAPTNPGYFMAPVAQRAQHNVPGYGLCPVSASVPMQSVPSTVAQPKTTNSNLSPVGKRLFQAHRIGMRALEMMAGRSDDRSYDLKRFSNPPHSDNIRWLEEKTGLLGKEDCYFKFCDLSARSVSSPILLADLIRRAIHRHPPHPNLYAIGNNTAQPAQPLRHIGMHNTHVTPAMASYKAEVKNAMVQYGFHPSIAELMRMTIEQFNTAAATLMTRSNLSASDVEEVGELIKSARDIFRVIPMYGPHIFEEYVRFLRKQKASKKEVLTRINEILNGNR